MLHLLLSQIFIYFSRPASLHCEENVEVYIYFYGLDGPGSNPGGDDIFRQSRPALVPTQPPVQWVPCFTRVKVRPGCAADHARLVVPLSWKNRVIPLPTLRATLSL